MYYWYIVHSNNELIQKERSDEALELPCRFAIQNIAVI